jgi:hypothetical protein
MPVDLTELVESLQRGLGEIPPVAVALGLLAGPTAALIVYRLFTASRRLPIMTGPEVAPFWVCHDCRSVNELRLSRCYRCGTDRNAVDEIEVIVDTPPARPTTFEAPAGSPFAAIGGMVDQAGHGPGIPVMAEDARRSPVPVGPGEPNQPGATEPADDASVAVPAERPA